MMYLLGNTLPVLNKLGFMFQEHLKWALPYCFSLLSFWSQFSGIYLVRKLMWVYEIVLKDEVIYDLILNSDNRWGIRQP